MIRTGKVKICLFFRNTRTVVTPDINFYLHLHHYSLHFHHVLDHVNHIIHALGLCFIIKFYIILFFLLPILLKPLMHTCELESIELPRFWPETVNAFAIPSYMILWRHFDLWPGRARLGKKQRREAKLVQPHWWWNINGLLTYRINSL